MMLTTVLVPDLGSTLSNERPRVPVTLPCPTWETPVPPQRRRRVAVRWTITKAGERKAIRAARVAICAALNEGLDVDAVAARVGITRRQVLLHMRFLAKAEVPA